MSCSRSAAFLLMSCMTSTLALAQRCEPSFYDSVRLDLHGAQNVVAAPDLDRDGRPDLVFADPDGLKIAMNLGGGAFSPPRTVLQSQDSYGFSVAVGDIDGDGLPDLVAAGTTGVRVLLGRIGFQPAAWSDASAANSPILADFDGDGILDLAYILISSGSLRTLKGDGRGGFGPAVDIVLPSPLFANSLYAFDVNGDGRSDILVSVGWNDPHYTALLTFLSVANGSWVQSQTGPFGGGFEHRSRVLSADLDGDGHPDAIVLTSSFLGNRDESIDVYLWRPSGLLHAFNTATGGVSSVSSALADFDGDGRLDLLDTQGSGLNVRLVVWLGDGSGRFRATPGFPLLTSAAPVVAGDFDGDGRPDVILGGSVPRLISNKCWSGYQRTVVVPILVSKAGAAGTFWTSDLTITNSGSTPARVDLTYMASAGGGEGTVTTTLAPGAQLSDSSAFELLARLGLVLPPADSRIATLRVVFHGLSSEGSGSLSVRTYSGGAGVSYPAIDPASRAPTSLAIGTVVRGLRQDARDRSNLGLAHTGRPDDGPLTLAVTVVSTDPSATGSSDLPPIRLQPGEVRQIDRVLEASGLRATSGYARIVQQSPVSPLPFVAWGVVNDNTGTSDGSFFFGGEDGGGGYGDSWVIPSVTESGSYQTELVLTGLPDISSTVTLLYRSPNLASPAGNVSMKVTLSGQGELRIPNVVGALRGADPAGVGPPGRTYAGVLEIRPDWSPVWPFARVLGVAQRYGVSIAPIETSFVLPAPVHAAVVPDLRQDSAFRSNLVIAEIYAFEPYAFQTPSVYRVELFDAAGSPVADREIRMDGCRWLQINGILADWAPGTTRGWARVTQVEPPRDSYNQFVTYAVINDGAAPGLGTGDGSIVWMETEP